MNWDRHIGKKNNGFWVLGCSEIPIYLLKLGDDYVLIEGGLTRLYPIVKKQLQEIVGNLAKINYWIITHAHYDHCGLLPLLIQDLNQVTILASFEAADTFKNPKAVGHINRFNQVAAHESHSFNTIPLKLIGDNECLELSKDFKLHFLKTPGHSDCSISVWDEKNGRLFVSDAFGEIQSPSFFFPLFFEDRSQYIRSIEKLSAIPAKEIAFGHQGYVRGELACTASALATEGVHFLSDLVEKKIKRGKLKDDIIDELYTEFSGFSATFVPVDLFKLSMKRLMNIIIQDFTGSLHAV